MMLFDSTNQHMTKERLTDPDNYPEAGPLRMIHD